jgi:hypothetical protein
MIAAHRNAWTLGIWKSLLLLLFFFLTCFPAHLHATSFQAVPFEQTVQGAPVVARGQVASQYVEWATARNGSRRLYTYIELQPLQFYKAPASWLSKTRLLVREMGGEKDGVGMMVPGSAQFKVGEDVVVFVGDQAHTDGAYDLMGLMLSKLKVTTGEGGEERLSGPAISMGESAVRGQIVYSDGSSEGGHDHGGSHSDEGGQSDTTRRGKKQWTVQSLRELIVHQGVNAIPPRAKDEKNPINSSAAGANNPSASSLLSQSGVEGKSVPQESLTGRNQQDSHSDQSASAPSSGLGSAEKSEGLDEPSSGVFATGVWIAGLSLLLAAAWVFFRKR